MPTHIEHIAAHRNMEESAARLYLAASAWCEAKNWVGFSAFFAKEAVEEYGHAKAFQDYALDRFVTVQIGAQPAMPAMPDDPLALVAVVSEAIAMEEKVLADINAIYREAAGDIDAVRFLQPFADAGVKQIRDLDVVRSWLNRVAGNFHAIQDIDSDMAERTG